MESLRTVLEKKTLALDRATHTYYLMRSNHYQVHSRFEVQHRYINQSKGAILLQWYVE